MVKLLRGAGHLPDEALAVYGKGEGFDTSTAMRLGLLVTHHTAMQQQIVDGLCELDAERFQDAAPFSPVDDPNETLGSLLAKMISHETYHAGQTGILRRIAGLKGAIGRA
jgi:uncharacterized damage-inducible protein DinB